ncbi:hypothetical protein BDQ17DRAFT_1436431 [Cyathus striatus]|nr:hypothetical protein BDQ17DRAFT_1436431 [Cyathus striatus]
MMENGAKLNVVNKTAVAFEHEENPGEDGTESHHRITLTQPEYDEYMGEAGTELCHGITITQLDPSPENHLSVDITTAASTRSTPEHLGRSN